MILKISLLLAVLGVCSGGVQHEELSHQPAEYSFAYNVQDRKTEDLKDHHEESQGGVTRGEYSLIEPDGTKRIVKYTVDGKSGFNAVVTREGKNIKETYNYGGDSGSSFEHKGSLVHDEGSQNGHGYHGQSSLNYNRAEIIKSSPHQSSRYSHVSPQSQYVHQTPAVVQSYVPISHSRPQSVSQGGILSYFSNHASSPPQPQTHNLVSIIKTPVHIQAPQVNHVVQYGATHQPLNYGDRIQVVHKVPQIQSQHVGPQVVQQVVHHSRPSHIIQSTPRPTIHQIIHSTPRPIVQHIHSTPRPIIQQIHSTPQPIIHQIHATPQPIVHQVNNAHQPVIHQINNAPQPVIHQINNAHQPIIHQIHATPQPIVHQVSNAHQPIIHQIHATPQPIVHQVSNAHQPIIHQIHATPQPIVHQVSNAHQPIIHQIHATPQPIIHQIHATPQPIVHQVSNAHQPIIYQVNNAPQPIIHQIHAAPQPIIQQFVHSTPRPTIHQIIQSTPRPIIHQIVNQDGGQTYYNLNNHNAQKINQGSPGLSYYGPNQQSHLVVNENFHHPDRHDYRGKFGNRDSQAAYELRKQQEQGYSAQRVGNAQPGLQQFFYDRQGEEQQIAQTVRPNLQVYNPQIHLANQINAYNQQQISKVYQVKPMSDDEYRSQGIVLFYGKENKFSNQHNGGHLHQPQQFGTYVKFNHNNGQNYNNIHGNQQTHINYGQNHQYNSNNNQHNVILAQHGNQYNMNHGTPLYSSHGGDGYATSFQNFALKGANVYVATKHILPQIHHH